MSRRVCRACGGEFLKGTRATVIGAKGAAVSIVCPACARGGALLVPVVVPPVVKKVEQASDDVERAIRLLTSYTKPYRLSPPEPGSFEAGRLEGLEAGIEVLRKLRGPS